MTKSSEWAIRNIVIAKDRQLSSRYRLEDNQLIRVKNSFIVKESEDSNNSNFYMKRVHSKPQLPSHSLSPPHKSFIDDGQSYATL
jgi:hypothetical protein